MAQSTVTMEQVKAELARIDPSLHEGHKYYKCALFMVAAVMGLGQSDVALHKFTGFSRGWLIRRIKNLKKAGIWKDGQFFHHWYDEGFGAVELRLDIKTAEGEMDEEAELDSPGRSRSSAGLEEHLGG